MDVLQEPMPAEGGVNADDPRRSDLPNGEMEVVATLPGHYGGLYRKVGDVFVLANAKQEFSYNWMKSTKAPVVVEEPKPVVVSEAQDGRKKVKKEE